MSVTKKFKPTDGELEILQILWDKKNATVREVYEVLSHTKDVGYTTILKLMQIMFEKGLVARDETNKTHIYRAIVSKEKTQTVIVDKMIQTLFSGSPAKLVLQALGNYKTSKEELDEISNFLKTINK